MERGSERLGKFHESFFFPFESKSFACYRYSVAATDTLLRPPGSKTSARTIKHIALTPEPVYPPLPDSVPITSCRYGLLQLANLLPLAQQQIAGMHALLGSAHILDGRKVGFAERL